jgi:hypothetical protein
VFHKGKPLIVYIFSVQMGVAFKFFIMSKICCPNEAINVSFVYLIRCSIPRVEQNRTLSSIETARSMLSSDWEARRAQATAVVAADARRPLLGLRDELHDEIEDVVRVPVEDALPELVHQAAAPNSGDCHRSEWRNSGLPAGPG